ncbi:MAG: discoidin domain-containing protein [Lewinellaceae bacterium]|nr:discoidin domain-containing protein [Saprospiraceae bacterium]MCB9333050.1 discoidin domain-containing protein [Lewinellaceae bacterium]
MVPKSNFILYLFLVLLSQIGFSQVTIYPCGGLTQLQINEEPNLALGKITNQSSHYYVDGGFSTIAVDGNNGTLVGPSPEGTARTNFELEPWWDVDLGNPYFIRGVTIDYPANAYPQGLRNFYILLSDIPFRDNSLNDAIAADHVTHIYVTNPVSSGQEIQTYYRKARYVRIHLANQGAVTFAEVRIPGGPGGGNAEICDNGIDDDFDCKTDCEDPECGPVIWAVNKKDPTCNICYDGWIEIKAYGDNLQYSIDGGQSFYSCHPVNQSDWCGFDYLPVGNYEVAVTNGVCTTFWRGNPVRLRAPQGDPGNDLCQNSGFEDGDGSHWSGTYGINQNGNYVINVPNAPVTSSPDDGFQIVSSGWVDPKIGLTINAPIGTYFGRVGFPVFVTNRTASSLRYCLTVDATNVNNQFYYYLVFEDGEGVQNHITNPFFEWRILDNNGVVLQTLGRYTADINSPFFTHATNDPHILYKEWSCEDLNLQAYMGQTICIEFIGARCDPGGHFGYAYIDGLCGETPGPYAELETESDIYCIGNEVNIKIENEARFNYHKIELSRVDANGNLIGTTKLSEQLGFHIPDLNDIIGLYKAANPNYTFDCEDDWRIKLTLKNACNEVFEVEKNVDFVCVEYLFEYKDIIACLGNLQDIPMQGTTDCSGCSNYQWSILNDPNTNSNSVGTYLDNPNAPYPLIKYSTNIYALGPTYQVRATSPEGCVLIETVNTTSLPDFSAQMQVTLNEEPKDVCTFAAETTITFSSPINSDLLEVIFYIRSDYGQPTPPGVVEEKFDGLLVSAPGTSNTHVFRPDIEHLLRGFDHQIRVVVRPKGYELPDVAIIGACSHSVTLNRTSDSPFFGMVGVFIPNAFSPLNPQSSPLYFPSFEIVNGPVIIYPNTIYEAWMSVWDRASGGLVHEAHVVSTNNQPINPVDLAWDGKWKGQWAANGEYDVLVDYQSCQVAPSECFGNQQIIGPKLGFGDVGNGAGIKPYHFWGLTGNPCTPDPMLCFPPTTIKSYNKCHKFHCSENIDCHHIQVVKVAN